MVVGGAAVRGCNGALRGPVRLLLLMWFQVLPPAARWLAKALALGFRLGSVLVTTTGAA